MIKLLLLLASIANAQVSVRVVSGDGLAAKQTAIVERTGGMRVAPTRPVLVPFNESSKLRFISGLAGVTDIDSGSTGMHAYGS